MHSSPKIQLSKVERNKAKLIFATLVVTLTLRESMREMGLKDEDMYVVHNLTKLMDEYITQIQEGDRRNAALQRVQDARIKFTHKVASIDKGSAMVGGVEVFVGPVFKVSPGNRLHYTRTTLKKSLEFVIEKVPHKKEDAEKFARLFKEAVLSV